MMEACKSDWGFPTHDARNISKIKRTLHHVVEYSHGDAQSKKKKKALFPSYILDTFQFAAEA